MKVSKRKGRENLPMVRLHEATHASAMFHLGAKRLSVHVYSHPKSNGVLGMIWGGWYKWARVHSGWERAAVYAAPSLIHDLSDGDVGYLQSFSSKDIRKARRWLLYHKGEIMKAARKIVKMLDEDITWIDCHEAGLVSQRPASRAGR